MKKHFCFIIAFFLVLTSVTAQSDQEKAANNFRSFYSSFKKSNPADKNIDSLADFSDLWKRTGIPEEIKMMIEYDANKFYPSYLNYVKNTRDTLIKISSLTLNPAAISAYTKLKQSVFENEKSGKFNIKQDKIYSQTLLKTVDQTNPPQIGYHQTATIISRSKEGKIEKNKIIITYSNDLDAIEFVVVAE